MGMIRWCGWKGGRDKLYLFTDQRIPRYNVLMSRKPLSYKDWLGFIFILLPYVILTIPVMILIKILNLPIFPKTKREPFGPGVVCIIYAPVTFSERLIAKLSKLLP